MKLIRSLSLLLIVGIIMIGACGCMNHQSYNEEMLKKLESKYDKAFEIVTLSYEVDGENGNYYRAVCKEQGSDNTFVAYYYLSGSDYLLSEESGEQLALADKEPILVDNYLNLQLNLKVADYLESDNSDVLFAIADVGTFGYALTVEDIEKGIEHCLSNDAFDVQLKVYLFISSKVENKEQYDKELTQKILALNVYKQSIDIAYIEESELEAVKSEYYDDIYMIEDRLEEDQRVVRYSWYFAERGQGITEQKQVKGV